MICTDEKVFILHTINNIHCNPKDYLHTLLDVLLKLCMILFIYIYRWWLVLIGYSELDRFMFDRMEFYIINNSFMGKL